MNGSLLDIGLIFVFILVGGLFAAAEIALVSIREGQVGALTGRRGAAVRRLVSDPNRFLSAVQIGVTLAGFLSAAFGGATLAAEVAPGLVGLGLGEGTADVLALVLVTVVISYFSIVLSELVAKRLALQRTVPVALAVAPSLDRIATLARPVIWLLSRSTDIVVRLLGGDPGAAREEMSEDELRGLVRGHETLSEEERRIVDDVFEAGDRQLREVMVPRTEVDFLRADLPLADALTAVVDQAHSRYPVIGTSPDDVVGFVHVRDLFDPAVQGRRLRIGQLARPALSLPSTRNVLAALSDMRREGNHLAVVVDEYGGTDGIVTMEDLVEELVGDIRDEYDEEEPVHDVRREGEDVEVDGRTNLPDLRHETGIELPTGPYETVAGFLAARLGRIPETGDEVVHDGRRIVVTEVDGRRVSRVRVAAPREDDALA